MIPLTRLNGEKVAINPDRIERADITPDVVLTMADGSKFVVAESVDELIDAIRLFRASVLALSHRLVFEEDANEGESRLRVVRGSTKGPVVDRHEVYDHTAMSSTRPVPLRAVARGDEAAPIEPAANGADAGASDPTTNTESTSPDARTPGV